MRILSFFDEKRTFIAVPASLGASYALSDAWRVGVNSSRTSRAPSAEEPFAYGPHAGTQAFEIGDPNFKLERSWGLEGTLRGKGRGYSFEALAFYNWFDDFIHDSPSSLMEDGLPMFQARQAKARY